ncbi:alaserpin-like [Paramacrobiotus metropolitanus]|uniref:alaserpin-like n=1 Tax=Paramacrobiotus metropolitanus TaxID=2943436 RepID=UPI002445924C|nr:alaserpin-like [Paramacrobiotus metropolitanus]
MGAERQIRETFKQLLDTKVAKLYSATTALKPDGNLAVSPLSILYASALIYIGSSGSTKSNSDKSVHFDQYFMNNASVLSAFSTSMANFTSAHPSSSAVNQLKSEAEFKDFRVNAEKARGEINTWVSDKTNGRIKDLLPTDAVSPSSFAVLASVLYFKASWETALKFSPSNTKKRDLALLNGQNIQVDTMSNSAYRLPYAEDSDLDAKYIEYSYTNSQDAMLFLLPNRRMDYALWRKS